MRYFIIKTPQPLERIQHNQSWVHSKLTLVYLKTILTTQFHI